MLLGKIHPIITSNPQKMNIFPQQELKKVLFLLRTEICRSMISYHILDTGDSFHKHSVMGSLQKTSICIKLSPLSFHQNKCFNMELKKKEINQLILINQNGVLHTTSSGSISCSESHKVATRIFLTSKEPLELRTQQTHSNIHKRAQATRARTAAYTVHTVRKDQAQSSLPCWQE